MKNTRLKYFRHKPLGELLNELRNKMETVQPSYKKEKIKKETKRILLKTMPLIFYYLKNFDRYELNIKNETMVS